MKKRLINIILLLVVFNVIGVSGCGNNNANQSAVIMENDETIHNSPNSVELEPTVKSETITKNGEVIRNSLNIVELEPTVKTVDELEVINFYNDVVILNGDNYNENDIIILPPD